MTLNLLLFLALAVIAIASAAGLIMSRNTVYSALFLIINFLTVAVFYLVMGAPFIALAQITVYAGAIMVLFLFVIMMLGAEKPKETEQIKWQRPLAIVLSGAILLEGVYALITRVAVNVTTSPATEALSDPKTLGISLYTKYSLPFEITSVILLVAAIGAVVLTNKTRKEAGK
ncbi:MAG: NADH-quinone oxidoreductase subunit J [Chloroflexi bacterium HGW-Chloroflexi-5]|jgi:NADH-quinone oxidoreductase subunit J|nr:MAG: NADH-quinone oxidoreductase subunit J [Chloroflexi bacterium HGW-Chloroflexi-5]